MKTFSGDRCPEPSVAITDKVTDVHRGDDDLVTRQTDRRRTCGEDDVASSGVWRSRRYAADAGIGPELGGSPPFDRRDWSIQQTAESNQFIEAQKRS